MSLTNCSMRVTRLTEPRSIRREASKESKLIKHELVDYNEVRSSSLERKTEILCTCWAA
jgi:hypothetical protein